MLRVLNVMSCMNRGGAETVAMNIHRNIDRSKIQFDYVIHQDGPQDYEQEIYQLGGKIYRTQKFSGFNYFHYKKFWRNFFTQHPEHKIVHAHFNNFAALFLPEAKKFGKITIAHSHGTKYPIKSLRNLASRYLLMFPLRYIADYFLACSKQAGIDRYGSKVSVMFLPNGIDTPKYTFNREIRKAIRESRGITSEDTIVVGHVGRFDNVKNHPFLIDAFNAFHHDMPNSKLWLIGRNLDGPSTEAIVRKKIEQYGITEAVDFIGTVSNVNEYLMGMDVFAFPSLLEGLGIALIEAEASGLPCVVSDRIQNEAIVSDRVRKFGICPPPST